MTEYIVKFSKPLVSIQNWKYEANSVTQMYTEGRPRDDGNLGGSIPSFQIRKVHAMRRSNATIQLSSFNPTQ
jgi:hypothetical protein